MNGSDVYQQHQQMMRDIMGQTAEAIGGPMGFYIKANAWMAAHPNTAWALVIAYSAALLTSVTHILYNFRGADRICWFLVVMALPFFGLLMYWLIGTNEKITETEADYIKRMSGQPSR